MLRPVGTADFDGVKLEVLAEGEFIEAGKPVRVVRVEGRKIVVDGRSKTDPNKANCNLKMEKMV